jgi:hypothetical protein
MFPERAEPPRRPILVLTLIVSALLHLAGAGTWLFFDARLKPVVAKLFPQPSPTPEIVALSDAITIEKRTVPRAQRRSSPRRAVRPQPRQVAQAPVTPSLPVPTLPPLRTPMPTIPPRRTPVPTLEPTAPPSAEATSRPFPQRPDATIHQPRSHPTPEPRPTVAPTVPPPPPASKNPFSPRQIAALDAQFSKTIAQAQHALTDVPPQRRPPARNPQQMRYEAIMAGTPEMFFNAAQGDCVDLQDVVTRGRVHVYYIRCTIRYSDGYFENVSYPWPYKFPANADPFQLAPGALTFYGQGPPPGFTLPPNFALSRAICTFYRAQCEDLIKREKANGNQPAPGG